MRKSTVITAVSLMIIGLILFTGVMAVYGFDFRKLSTVEYISKAVEFSENIENIKINTITAEIYILKSEDSLCRVELYEEEKIPHEVTLEDGTLCIEAKNNKKPMDYIGVNFDSSFIKIYLPDKEYDDLQIELSTGDVEISSGLSFGDVFVKGSTGNVSCLAEKAGNVTIRLSTGHIFINSLESEDIILSQSTGKTEISHVSCNSLEVTGTTGDVELNDVIAKDKFIFERSTGDIEFESCDAGDIFIKTSTGDVDGTLLSGKMFSANATTGDIEVPRSTNGGRCEIKTTTGDIEIEVR